MHYLNQPSLIVIDLKSVYYDLFCIVKQNIINSHIPFEESYIETINGVLDFVIGALITNLLLVVQTKDSYDTNYLKEIHDLAESMVDLFYGQEQAVRVIQDTETKLLNLFTSEIPNIDNLRIIDYKIQPSNILMIQYQTV